MRIIHPPTLELFRTGVCGWCGKPGQTQRHHVRCKGSGAGSRLDLRLNLLEMDVGCHRLFHDGHILRIDIEARVAQREGINQHGMRLVLDAILDLQPRPWEAKEVKAKIVGMTSAELVAAVEWVRSKDWRRP